MMWNWLVSALATGASVVLYDGSPLVPSPNVLWDLIDRLGYVNNVKQKGHCLCCCYVTTYKDPCERCHSLGHN